MLLLRIPLAIVFTGLGVAGLVLPILPGWVFILLGGALFFPSHPLSERAVARIERHAPSLTRLLRRLGVGASSSRPPA